MKPHRSESIGFLADASMLIQLGPRNLQIEPRVAFSELETAACFPVPTPLLVLFKHLRRPGMDTFKACQLRLELLTKRAAHTLILS